MKVVHIIIALALIIGVLLQSGKSAGLSGAIDGGASSFFDQGKQAEEKIKKITTVAAVLFMISSLILAAL
nr:preprotein translocase subunit SecG [Sporohalobacter salinus]